MVKVYTDVSIRKGKGIGTCFVQTDKNFLGYRTFEYCNVYSALQGELLCVLDGLKYLNSMKQSDKEIEVYCDSEAALSHLNKTSKSPMFRETLSFIFEECKDKNVKFLFVKGHQKTHNPNKVVDRVSNYVLRCKFPTGDG